MSEENKEIDEHCFVTLNRRTWLKHLNRVEVLEKEFKGLINTLIIEENLTHEYYLEKLLKSKHRLSGGTDEGR